MSSPRQNTFGSRSISSKCASRIASRYVISGIGFLGGCVRAPAFGTFVRVHDGAALAIPERPLACRGGVNPFERIERFGHRRSFRFVGRCVDFRADARLDSLELGGLKLE